MLPNNTEQVRPIINRFAYNYSGVLIATLDGNSNTNAYVLNAANQTYREVSDDGLSSFKSYDGYDRLNGVADDRQYWWQLIHDHKDRIIASVPPSGVERQERFQYNELSSRIADIYPNNTCDVYCLDMDQNVVASFEPMGQCTRRSFDWHSLQLTESNPDNSSRSWKRTLQGLVYEHSDLAGVTYKHEDDFAGRIIHVYSINASSKHGKMLRNKIDPTLPIPDISLIDTPDQNLTYTYVGELFHLSVISPIICFAIMVTISKNKKSPPW